MFSAFTWFFLSRSGRINRQEFLLGYIAVVLINSLLIRVLQNATLPALRYYDGLDLYRPHDWSILAVVLMIIWPLTAVFVKRMHDLNISGWWLLAILAIATLAAAVNVSAWIVIMLVVGSLGIVPGSSGSNQFGPDPLVHERAGI